MGTGVGAMLFGEERHHSTPIYPRRDVNAALTMNFLRCSTVRGNLRLAEEAANVS
jgi:hypothetical protein